MSTAQAATVDLFIIGGGINGCGIARQAPGVADPAWPFPV